MRHLIQLKARLFAHQLSPFFILLLLSFIERSHFLRPFPVEPLVVLPLIYYWALFKDEKLSALSLFALGLFDDAISGTYLGQTSLMFLVLYALILTQRHHIKDLNFKFVWGAFAIFMGCAMFLEWAISSLLVGKILSILPLMAQNILAVILYPWFNKLATKI